MNKTIQTLLSHHEQNHIFPFLWLHGEDEATLRKMVAVIHGASCRALCVESRPHPDFCGPKWWQDMDIILDEARKRDMKVWILDDSHFPTGFANGALADKPDSLCRQGIYTHTLSLDPLAGRVSLNLRSEGLMAAPTRQATTPMEEVFFNIPPARVFNDDRILRAELRQNGRITDLTDSLDGENLSFSKEQGPADLAVILISRNLGYRRNYINMTEKDSVRVLIDAVYEPHYQHYAADFGKTIAGFFSDEPEFGNGFMYAFDNPLGCDQDLPWSAEVEKALAETLGDSWKSRLFGLWRMDTDPETARVHMAYMDALTSLVSRHFSEQLGDWCRAHQVEYIGHLIEDNGHHCRTGSSLGHYFRALSGQDMAGIDDIGDQVLPQGEDEPRTVSVGARRDGPFYHYGLAKLGQTAAALEPRKKGRAMCEIFGNYGWAEGVRLEKYLADHFLVRGINYFVPHAFNGHPFPDSDCPPHFYAHGHHPQYRHFGALMTYMNRAADLISSGPHHVPVGVLYHGEAEWADPEALPFHIPGRKLYDAHLDYHVIPADFLSDECLSLSEQDKTFRINGRTLSVMVVPGSASLCAAASHGLDRLARAGIPVLFASRKPAFVSETGEALPAALRDAPVVSLDDLADRVAALPFPRPRISPACDRLRLLEIEGDTPMVFVVNEGTERWQGQLEPSAFPEEAFLYDPWDNCCRPVEKNEKGFLLSVDPLKPLFLVGGKCDALPDHPHVSGIPVPLTGWMRSTCEGAEYPRFSSPVPTDLPDGFRLAEEQPEFSGFVRYDCDFTLDADSLLLLCIGDAAEGVEVFLNGESAGLQIAPPMYYEFTGRKGQNHLRIEVATTLERECYPLREGHLKFLAPVPTCPSGLTGEVQLLRGTKGTVPFVPETN